MEKHSSFSLKHTRFFLFSLTISFSFIFLTFFSFWAFKTAPFSQQPFTINTQQPNNQTSSRFEGFQRSQAPNLKDAKHSFFDSNSSLNQTRFGNPLNSSETAKISSRFEGFQRKSSEVKIPNVNGTKVSYFDSNLHLVNQTQVGKPLSSSESSRFAGFQRKSTEIKVPSLEDGVNGTKDLVFEGSFMRPKGSRRKGEERLCDVSRGRWVFDDSYPLYTAATCPFIDEGFNCEENGRLDKDYMKWRWKPQECDLPRFNATNMLEVIRGKRLVFVGDSINRNQWESMLCLLTSAIKDRSRVYETHRRRITKEKGNYCFRFVDYECTVEYYVSHFLVHESKARIGRKRTQTLRIDAVDRGSSRWKGAHVLVFNTAHWWSHYKTKSGINYYQEGGQVLPRLDVSTAFRKSMLTWASWVDQHIDPRKTQVVFRSSAPSHFWGGEWNAGGHCKEARLPLNRTASLEYPETNTIVEEVIKQMKTPIKLLNITSMSNYRIDGHPSVYGRKRAGTRGEDCSHWCLPGVPDIWNQLLYYHLQL